MFEGSEKKIEVIFSPDSPSLLELPLKFWKKIVRSCGAEIISQADFPEIHSYILSESSLFVWSHRLVLITCGKTALSQSFIKILKIFPKESIEVCFFQRKNEFFPSFQKSCFYRDLKKIQRTIPGKAYRFGPLHDHHFFLFHSSSDFEPSARDQTLETLIYDSKAFSDSSPHTVHRLKRELEKSFCGFEIQDQMFSPQGYSLNAIKGDLYYTAHITPEKSFFYISFETNIQEDSVQSLTDKILNIFEPKQFDFILFEPRGQKKESFALPDYFSGADFYQVLDCGYNITYKNFYSKKMAEQKPAPINLISDS